MWDQFYVLWASEAISDLVTFCRNRGLGIYKQCKFGSSQLLWRRISSPSFTVSHLSLPIFTWNVSYAPVCVFSFDAIFSLVYSSCSTSFNNLFMTNDMQFLWFLFYADHLNMLVNFFDVTSADLLCTGIKLFRCVSNEFKKLFFLKLLVRWNNHLKSTHSWLGEMQYNNPNK